MPRVFNLQTSFNSGVLDPRLAARTDLKHFYQGAAVAENVQSLPQGGMKRRPGFRFIDSITKEDESGNLVAAESRLAAFAFNVEQTYLLVFTDQKLSVYRDGDLQAIIVTPYTTEQLFELQWTQSADTMIIVHKDHQPRKLVRGSSHTSWSTSLIGLTGIPKFSFEDQTYSTELSVAATVSQVTISVDSTADFPSSGWLIIDDETMSYTGKTATGFIGIIRGVDASVAEAHAIDAKVEYTENVWSDARGWPKSVTFYQGRMWFGGSRSRPQTIWGSVTNDFFNFAISIDALDDEGIDVTLDTDQVNAVTAIYAGRHLQIFTTGGEFSINDVPITPAKSAVQRHTLFGSGTIPPKSIDGATLFLDRTGKGVREFLFAYAENAYTSGTVSLLASHLLDHPVDMDVLRGTGSAEANYVYFVNSDGTVAVFNTLRAQEVGGWTQWTTSGEIEGVAVVVEDVYFIVKRTINGQVVRYLEMLDEDSYTDANVVKTQAASATVTGLDHLDGEDCRVRANGAIVTNETPAAGSITLDRDATEVEVGLNFNTKIQTMPVNQDFQDGPTLTKKKRIVRVVISLYESSGVSINGERIVDRNFGMALGNNIAPFSGSKPIYLLGWTEQAQVEITQTDPAPMTVLGLGLEVET